MEILVGEISDHNGVISPIDVSGGIPPADFFQGFDRRRSLHHIGFKSFRECVDGELAITIVPSRPDFVQVIHEWAKILRPEDKAHHILRGQGNKMSGATKGIHVSGKTLVQSVHEPVAIKCRDIGPAGHGYDSGAIR